VWWCTHHPAGRYVPSPFFQHPQADLDESSSSSWTTRTGDRTTTTTTTTTTRRTTMTTLACSTCSHSRDVVNVGSGPMARPFGDDDEVGDGLTAPVALPRRRDDVRATSFDVSSLFVTLFQRSPAVNHGLPRSPANPCLTHWKTGAVCTRTLGGCGFLRVRVRCGPLPPAGQPVSHLSGWMLYACKLEHALNPTICELK
jgi:hypothetical protein